MGLSKKDTPNQSLTEFVLLRLRADIVCGDFAPSAKLNIESLKKRYQVGGTPIREALNQLVSPGVVEALPLKGFRVSALSSQKAEDIYQARALVEKKLLVDAIEGGDDAWEAQCVARLHRLKRCIEHPEFIESVDIIKWMSLQQAFWQAVFSVCQSTCLFEFEQQLSFNASRYEYLHYQRSDEAMALMARYLGLLSTFWQHCLDKAVSPALDSHQDYLDALLNRVHQVVKETE